MPDFNLEKALAGISERYTAEQRADDEQARLQRLAAMKPGLDPNSYDQRVARARQQLMAIVEQIEMLQAAPNSELKEARLLRATKRFGELVAETGDFESAAAITPDPKQAAWFDSLLDAIDKDDSDSCGCPDTRAVDQTKNREVTMPVRTVIAEIPSAKHGRLMKVERCSTCGFLNAR